MNEFMTTSFWHTDAVGGRPHHQPPTLVLRRRLPKYPPRGAAEYGSRRSPGRRQFSPHLSFISAFARPVGSGHPTHPHHPSHRFLNFRNFACQRAQISSLIRAVPSHRGALRNVINAGRDAVDAAAPLTNGAFRVRPSRVVLTPRCWRQVCEKERRRRCQTSLVTGESAK